MTQHAAWAFTAAFFAVAVLIDRRRRTKSRRRRTPISACTQLGDGFAGLVGNTPMIQLSSLSRATGCTILGKAEFLNPGGCQKDRVAKRIIEEAEAKGLLKEGGTVIEGTSGSTGISLSLMCRARGYKCIIVMPDDQAKEKTDLLKCYGAEIRLVRPAAIVNKNHYCNVAEQLAKETPGAFFADQFETTANFNAHYFGTGPEIWTQTGGKVDAFVMSAGTGGTIAGVSQFLKEKSTSSETAPIKARAKSSEGVEEGGIKVILADPPGSSLYNKVKHGVCYAPQQAEKVVRRHRYDTIAEGIGLDRVTKNFSLARIDDAVQVTDKEMTEMAAYLLREDGLFIGSSAATNCVAAVRVAKMLGPGHTIVTVLCDSGNRHLTKFWNPEFLGKWGLTAQADGLNFIK